MFGWALKTQTPTKKDRLKYNMKVSHTQERRKIKYQWMYSPHLNNIFLNKGKKNRRKTLKGGITILENNRRHKIRPRDITTKLTTKQHGEHIHHNIKKTMTTCSKKQT